MDYFIVLKYFKPGFLDWVIEVSAIITILIQRAFVVQLLMIIESRYKRMNKYLLWHKYTYSTNGIVNNSEETRDDSLTSVNSDFSFDQAPSQPPSDKSNRLTMFINKKSIKSFIQIHYDLKAICKITNDMFGSAMFLLVIYSVIRIMLFYYVLSFIIVSMINDTDVRFKYKTFTCFIFWIIRMNWEMYAIARHCHNITEEANMTCKVLNRVQQSKSSICLAHFVGILL
uniref:Gustatory receptor n=2 Tax=Cacopsylla melanoneura TaxID=428564 RepID=A0A8D8M8I0_9HEMI